MGRYCLKGKKVVHKPVLLCDQVQAYLQGFVNTPGSLSIHTQA
ncbi:hypothetical protein AM1_B0408 (plasmid) [Acaryochloris marina MBIC11017]|uniref:Uncharacterized protein n=1 Tax=Acaryochloris marina (strain MBIC 11017) TaxID=329726 RepID=A8ZLU9_ACAM1|nr:hypothetical protein AM1_B0408 [Acaryochloris marina MBIC11017]